MPLANAEELPAADAGVEGESWADGDKAPLLVPGRVARGVPVAVEDAVCGGVSEAPTLPEGGGEGVGGAETVAPAEGVAPALSVGAGEDVPSAVCDALELPEGVGSAGLPVNAPTVGVGPLLIVVHPDAGGDSVGAAEALPEPVPPAVTVAGAEGLPVGGGEALPLPVALTVCGAVDDAEALPVGVAAAVDDEVGVGAAVKEGAVLRVAAREGDVLEEGQSEPPPDVVGEGVPPAEAVAVGDPLAVLAARAGVREGWALGDAPPLPVTSGGEALMAPDEDVQGDAMPVPEGAMEAVTDSVEHAVCVPLEEGVAVADPRGEDVAGTLRLPPSGVGEAPTVTVRAPLRAGVEEPLALPPPAVPEAHTEPLEEEDAVRDVEAVPAKNGVVVSLRVPLAHGVVAAEVSGEAEGSIDAVGRVEEEKKRVGDSPPEGVTSAEGSGEGVSEEELLRGAVGEPVPQGDHDGNAGEGDVVGDAGTMVALPPPREDVTLDETTQETDGAPLPDPVGELDAPADDVRVPAPEGVAVPAKDAVGGAGVPVSEAELGAVALERPLGAPDCVGAEDGEADPPPLAVPTPLPLAGEDGDAGSVARPLGLPGGEGDTLGGGEDVPGALRVPVAQAVSVGDAKEEPLEEADASGGVAVAGGDALPAAEALGEPLPLPLPTVPAVVGVGAGEKAPEALAQALVGGDGEGERVVDGEFDAPGERDSVNEGSGVRDAEGYAEGEGVRGPVLLPPGDPEKDALPVSEPLSRARVGDESGVCDPLGVGWWVPLPPAPPEGVNKVDQLPAPVGVRVGIGVAQGAGERVPVAQKEGAPLALPAPLPVTAPLGGAVVVCAGESVAPKVTVPNMGVGVSQGVLLAPPEVDGDAVTPRALTVTNVDTEGLPLDVRGAVARGEVVPVAEPRRDALPLPLSDAPSRLPVAAADCVRVAVVDAQDAPLAVVVTLPEGAAERGGEGERRAEGVPDSQGDTPAVALPAPVGVEPGVLLPAGDPVNDGEAEPHTDADRVGARRVALTTPDEDAEGGAVPVREGEGEPLPVGAPPLRVAAEPSEGEALLHPL